MNHLQQILRGPISVTMEDSKHIILIAEDEPDIADQLVEILWPLGVAVITARDGKEMLEKILENPRITAVLSDINMPIFNGIEVLREIRQRGRDLPVVFLTALNDKNMIVEALRLGAMDFLEKPYDIHQLRSVMSKALSLGIEIKNVDEDLARIAKEKNISDQDLAQFKAIQRPILVMKLKNKHVFKKTSS